jgi:ribosomal-protein-alanine N-acetyltransferase
MKLTETLITTPRLVLTSPVPGHAEAMLDYYERNKSNFRAWEPRRTPEFYTLASMRARIDRMVRDMHSQTALHLLLLEPGAGRMIGECGFTNIVRGPFQACHLGFSICREYQGKGLMHEALRASLEFVFARLELHRVMANYRPENARSHKLLQRLGFEQEGRARAYLEIDGRWADHILTSLINDRSHAPASPH